MAVMQEHGYSLIRTILFLPSVCASVLHCVRYSPVYSWLKSKERQSLKPKNKKKPWAALATT